jgi:hypothetical protein
MHVIDLRSIVQVVVQFWLYYKGYDRDAKFKNYYIRLV